uniref:Outer capsid protein VP2 n=1 Tax=Corriparta virus TaxID=40053 RepID=A0A8E8PI38_9REOV|nr:major outer capsid protein [Corriparta virus]
MAEYNIAVLERTVEFDQIAKCMLKDADVIVVAKQRWPEDVDNLTKNRSVKISQLTFDQNTQGLMVHHLKDKKAGYVYDIEPVVANSNIVQRLYYSMADESINIRMLDRTDGYETASKIASDFMNAKVIVKSSGYNEMLRLDTQIGLIHMSQSFFTVMHLARHTICVDRNLHPIEVAREWYDQAALGWMKRRIPNVKVGAIEYAHGKFPSDEQLQAGAIAMARYDYSQTYKRMKASWHIYKVKELMNTAWKANTVYGPEVQMLGVTSMYVTKDLHEDDKAIADVNSFAIVWGLMATQAPYYRRFSKILTHDLSCRPRVLLRVNNLRAIELYFILTSRLMPPWYRSNTKVSTVDVVDGKESFQLKDVAYEDVNPLAVIRDMFNRDLEQLPPFSLPRKNTVISVWMRENFPYLHKLYELTKVSDYTSISTIHLMEITCLNNLLLLLITLIPGANIEKSNRLDVAVFETRSDANTVQKLQEHEKHQWEYADPAVSKNLSKKITLSMAVSTFSASFSSFMGVTLHQVADLQRVGLADEDYYESTDKYESLGDKRDQAWTDEKAKIDKMAEGPAKVHALKMYGIDKEHADHRNFFLKTAKRVAQTVDRAWNFQIKSLDYVTFNQVSGIVSYHCRGFTDVITSSIPLRAPRKSHIPILLGPGYLKLHDLPHLLRHRFPLSYDSTTGAIGILIDHEDKVTVWKEGDIYVKVRDLLIGKVKGKLITISVEGGVFGSKFYGVKLGSVS